MTDLDSSPQTFQSTSRTIKTKLISLASNSSAHGISNIIRTPRPQCKCIWFIFLLLSAALCTLLVIQNIINYLEFSVTTKVYYVNEDLVDFPSISICNSNPFLTEFAVDTILEILGNNSASSNETFQNTQNLPKLDYLNSILITHGKHIQHMIRVYFQIFNETIKRQFSFPVTDVVLKCQFQDRECNASDFSWFWHYDHGNCYVINSVDKPFGNLQVKSAGINNALVLEMFVGFEQLIPIFDLSYGMVVKVFQKRHNTDLSEYFKMVNVKVGTETNIAISRTKVNKMKKPYSNCEYDAMDADDQFNSELIREIVSKNHTYLQIGCQKLCFNQIRLRLCNCSKVSKNNCLSSEQVECDLDVYKRWKNLEFSSECNPKCPLECETLTYSIDNSYKSFPSNYYAEYLLENKNVFRGKIFSRPVTVEDVKKSVLRLVIYYEHLSYQLIEEIPTMTFVDLMANIGGMLGLFMGMSYLSFIEFFEMAFETVAILFSRENHTKRV